MKIPKQRIFSILAVLSMVMILMCIFAACEKNDVKVPGLHPSEGLKYELNEEGNYEYFVTDIGSCTDKNVVIPSEYNSRVVKGISSKAFKDCTGIENIIIPDSVTYIGYSAFEGCTKLNSVTLGNGLKYISSDAFYKCHGLRKVYIKNLEQWCAINFGNDYANPMKYALDLYLNGAKPSGDFKIPDKVTTIPNGTFEYSYDLTSITISKCVTRIGDFAFCGCSGLTSITIPDSVTNIGDSAFSGCSRLTNVTMGDSVNSIGAFAFSECHGLTRVTIPNGVTNIGYKAFTGCSGLTSIEIPNSVTRIGNYAFYNTAWYNNQPDGLVYAGKVAYEYKGTMPSNTSIVIKEGTISIEKNAFYGCSGLTSVIIPNSVTDICNSAFYGCSGLTSVTIGNGVTNIGYDAFSGCSNLTCINYQGTISQWNTISKKHSLIPSTCTIICSNGTIMSQKD